MAPSDNQPVDSGWKSRAVSLGSANPSGDRDGKSGASRKGAGETESGEQLRAGWHRVSAEDAYAATEQPAGDDPSDALPRRKRLTWIEWTGAALVVAMLAATWILSSREPPVADSGTAAPGKENRTRNNRQESRRKRGKESAENASLPTTRERATAIADLLLEDAGDGSFSLSLEDSAGAGDASAAPTMKANPRSSDPKPAGRTPSSNPDPARRKTSYPKPVNPQSISPVKRLANDASPAMEIPESTPLLPYKKSSLQFKRLYDDAYETHQDYLDAKSENPGSDQARTLLAESLLLFQQCLARPRSELNEEQRQQLQYALAGLFLDSGRPFEASVFGLHVTGVAPAEEALTASSAAIAFTALQLSHQSHYGDPRRPGELLRLEQLLDTAQRRGIKLSQVADRRFAVAQLFDRDGFHLRAAQSYAKIPESATLYPLAQLQTGLALRSEAQRRKQDGIEQQQDVLISTAARYLDDGIKRLDAKQDESAALAIAKISLSRLLFERQDDSAAIALLEGERGVLSTPKLRRHLSEALIASAYDSLLAAYSRRNDLAGVNETLNRLSESNGKQQKERVSALATRFIKSFSQDAEATRDLTAVGLDELDAIIKHIQIPPESKSLSTALWIAQCWSDLATSAEDSAVRESCLLRSETRLREVLDQSELKPAERLGLHLKLIDMAVAAGQPLAALKGLSEILKESPNAIDLQIRAAAILTAMAEASPTEAAYLAAIDGLPDDSLWGWNRLSDSLVRMHLDATDKTQHFQRLMESSYQLNRCRLQLAALSPSPEDRKRQIASAKRHIGQLLKTMTASSEEWTSKFESLLQEAEQT